MSNCPSYVAPHRNQLGADGGKYGGVNCTPCSGAIALDQGTCGAEKFTGAQIRAASNEPIPDPASPGLNLEQVDAAIFKLTHGRVDFDSRRMYPIERAIARIRGGEPAIIQYRRGILISLGLAFGNGFGGGHASEASSNGGSLYIDDPLTRRFAVTDAQFARICGSLVIGGEPIGTGNAYIGFGPDFVTAVPIIHRVSVHPADGTFGLYTVNPATRTVTATREARTGGFSARSTRAARFSWAGHTNQSLCMLLDGYLAAAGAKRGLTYAVRSAYEVI